MLDSDRKFREESQLPLLTSRFGWRETVKCCYQRLMVSEEQKRTTFKIRPEVENSRIRCLKFTVKGRVTLLSGRQLGRKEGKWLPMMRNVLLENTANVGI